MLITAHWLVSLGKDIFHNEFHLSMISMVNASDVEHTLVDCIIVLLLKYALRTLYLRVVALSQTSQTPDRVSRTVPRAHAPDEGH